MWQGAQGPELAQYRINKKTTKMEKRAICYRFVGPAKATNQKNDGKEGGTGEGKEEFSESDPAKASWSSPPALVLLSEREKKIVF
jgi:hypothetical protein